MLLWRGGLANSKSVLSGSNFAFAAALFRVFRVRELAGRRQSGDHREAIMRRPQDEYTTSMSQTCTPRDPFTIHSTTHDIPV